MDEKGSDDYTCFLNWEERFTNLKEVLLELNEKKCFGIKEGEPGEPPLPFLRVIYLEKTPSKEMCRMVACGVPFERIETLATSPLSPLGVWTLNGNNHFAVTVDNIDDILKNDKSAREADPLEKLLKSLNIEKGGRDESK